MNPIEQLHALGQSVWLDYIRKDLLESGELAKLISGGEVRGVTSNPTIFQQAIANSSLYDEAARPLAQAGWSDERIFELLAVDDIRAATELFLPLYERTEGADGFVSIEVSPRLAYDSQSTVAEARRLWSEVNRPNVMIKIPATEPGLPAIEQAIAEGINVNVTLVFSLKRYTQVMQAYLQGLERRLEAGNSLDHVASVASFFVSRVDTLVDGRLEQILREEGPKAPRAAALLGKAAIANAKLAYAQFEAFFDDDRFRPLREHGARLQRPLWASTSTKNPAYRDVVYVENLIGQHTVNTLPPATLVAFREHGVAEPTIEQGLSAARAQLEALEELGISMDRVTSQLETEGVGKFAESFEGLLDTLSSRGQGFRAELGTLQPAYRSALERVEQDRTGPRLWAREPSLWPAGETDETSRLDWLDMPKTTLEALEWAKSIGKAARSAGRTKLGWIAPGREWGLMAEVLEGYRRPGRGLELVGLESLDPAPARSFARQTPVQTSLFVLEQTDHPMLELQAGFEPQWQRARRQLGEVAGEAFAVLAEPGSPVVRLAAERGFAAALEVAAGPPGPFAALSPSELAPAQLTGVDAEMLLAGAAQMARWSGPNAQPARSPGLSLAAFLAAACEKGSTSLALLADARHESLARWVADMVRTCLGLEVRFSVVTSRNPRSPKPEACIYIRLAGEWDERMKGWAGAGSPVLVMQVGDDLRSLGAAVFRWQTGVACAAHLQGRSPFRSQRRRWAIDKLERALQSYRRSGKPAAPRGRDLAGGITVWPDKRWGKLPEASTMEQVAQALLAAVGAVDDLGLSLYPEGARGSRGQTARIQSALTGRSVADSESELEGGRPKEARQATLQVVLQPARDQPIPGLDIGYGALNQLLAWAEFEELQSRKAPAWGIRLPSGIRLKDLADTLSAVTSRRA